MTTQEGNNAVVARHLEALATAAKNYTLAELTNVSVGGASYAVATSSTDGLMSAADKTKLDNLTNYTLPTASTSVKGGVKIGSGLQMDGDTLNVTLQAGSAGGGIGVLDTVPSTVDGALWYEVTDNVPALWIHKGNYEYSFDGKLNYVGNNTNLVAHLPFTKSLADACSNEWLAFGTPTFYSETVYVNANNVNKAGRLYLNGASYLKNSTIADSIGSQPWSVDMWWEPQTDGFDHCPLAVNAINNDTNSDGALNFFIQPAQCYFWSSVVAENKATISPAITKGDLIHLAMTYDGSCLRTFVNGVLKQSITVSLTVKNIFSIGAMTTGSYPINGYVSHCRIHKGVALWTENFTPPTATDYA